MSIFSPPKWLRHRRQRWRVFAVVLLLFGLLAHPMSQAVAQQTDNTATANYSIQGASVDTVSNLVSADVVLPLIDPLGSVLGCDGQPLSSYDGFSAALYEPDASGLGLGNLLSLTPSDATNGIAPNITNTNPFPLDPNTGQYNFLLDENLGQTDVGQTYILVLSSPADSGFSERRVRIEMQGVTRNAAVQSVLLAYRATSLDGQPISIDGSTELTRSVEIRDAAFQSITFFTFGVESLACDTSQVSITKSADRSAAQPGDVVVYRLNIRNQAPVDIQSVTATDTFPTGFELVSGSSSAQVDGTSVPVTTTVSGNSVRFTAAGTLAPDATLDIVYVARVTPDALRGSGRNSALVSGRRTDSDFLLQGGPSVHRTVLDPGILSDCGTLIGRVFEDKDFDGEQQPGEAGIPNAVIFLDDGNRVVTDADGLFSVQKMLPGRRTGTLDLSSLPGYTLAANLRFNERNSLARLVNLAPGGLVRMNFGVTPTFQEIQE